MERKNNKKLSIAVVILVIILIALIVFILQSFSSNNQEEATFTASNRIINETNTITETVVNEQEQNIVQNNETQTNTAEENVVTGGSTSTETFEENPQTEEQKALDIAKKDWGNTEDIGDSIVYFDVDGIEPSGEYRVLVTQDTKLIAYYMVNVSEGTFTKKVLNQ